MNRKLFLLAIATLLVMHVNSLAQSQDLKKFEIAGEFSSIQREGFGQTDSEAGVGARFTFNLSRSLAFEAAGYFFPVKCVICEHGGTMSQVVAGAKYGKRFEKWGIFAKASRSTTRLLSKCSSIISATSVAFTCAYQTPSG